VIQVIHDNNEISGSGPSASASIPLLRTRQEILQVKSRMKATNRIADSNPGEKPRDAQIPYPLEVDRVSVAAIDGFSRRRLLAGIAGLSGLALSGCKTTQTVESKTSTDIEKPIRSVFRKLYGARPSEQFPIPAVNLNRIPERLLRQRVAYKTREPFGSVLVDTTNFYLYLVQGGGTAIRYGVGLGRAGFEWSGRARIGWKQRWPKWTPPDEMIERQPKLEKWSAENGGMPPGLANPLGARALYIFEGKRDTLYRIHGTSEYWTIGKAVSSGCVRMINQDVIDLYNRVRSNAPILVV